MKKDKKQLDTTKGIKFAIGWILIVIGGIGLLMNFTAGAEVEYVTHQTYYALKEIANLILILIGVLVMK